MAPLRQIGPRPLASRWASPYYTSRKGLQFKSVGRMAWLAWYVANLEHSLAVQLTVAFPATPLSAFNLIVLSTTHIKLLKYNYNVSKKVKFVTLSHNVFIFALVLSKRDCIFAVNFLNKIWLPSEANRIQFREKAVTTRNTMGSRCFYESTSNSMAWSSLVLTASSSSKCCSAGTVTYYMPSCSTTPTSLGTSPGTSHTSASHRHLIASIFLSRRSWRKTNQNTFFGSKNKAIINKRMPLNEQEDQLLEASFMFSNVHFNAAASLIEFLCA